MAISGHKSMESLTIYQKVNQNEKIQMGLMLGYMLLNPPSETQILALAQIKVTEVMPRQPDKCPTPTKQLKIAYEPEDPIPKPSTSNINMAVAVPDQIEETQYDISDQELLQLINDSATSTELTQYNEQIGTAHNKTKVTKQVLQKKMSPQLPIFNNCTFSGTVTFNINKS